MPFPQTLKDDISAHFERVGKEGETTFSLSTEVRPGEAEYRTFLRACGILMKDFSELDTESMLTLQVKLMMDTELREKASWVLNYIALRGDELLLSVRDGLTEIEFGQTEVAGQQKDLDMPEGVGFGIGLAYKMGEDRLDVEQLIFNFPEAISIEMLDDPDLIKRYFESVVGIIWLASEVSRDPDKYSVDLKKKKQDSSDLFYGPFGLIALAVAAGKGIRMIMDQGLWDGWKQMSPTNLE